MKIYICVILIMLVTGVFSVFASGQEELPKILVSDLKVLDTATAAGWELREDIQNGDLQFTDRVHKIVDLPEQYRGLDWIITAADSKSFSGETLATFTVHAETTVFVCIDNRIKPLPAWLSGWDDTGDALSNDEASPLRFKIWAKKFPKDTTVNLGPNTQAAGVDNYMVLIDGPRNKTKGAAINLEEYQKAEAIRIGDNYLLHQRNIGGWPKNEDLAKELSEHEKKIAEYSKRLLDATIDNGATTSELRYLARLYTATKKKRFKEGALKAIDYLLDAQYENGGWPQVFPISSAKVYNNAITYNDDAMINVLQLFRDIRDGYAEYSFVDEERRVKISKALDKGIDCILKTQVSINGKKTVWCAQHDEETLKPVIARSYELPSLSGKESVGIVKFLMEIKRPGPEIIQAVQSAVAWFDKVKITGIKVNEIQDDQGRDRIVVQDPEAGPLWGRFYDLETEKAFFCGRDGIKKNTMAEIERERRVGYDYYTDAPLYLIEVLYPKWQKQYALLNNF